MVDSVTGFGGESGTSFVWDQTSPHLSHR